MHLIGAGDWTAAANFFPPHEIKLKAAENLTTTSCLRAGECGVSIIHENKASYRPQSIRRLDDMRG